METTQTLSPGQSIDRSNGYVARSYAGSMSYYAEHLNEHGEGIALSPNFSTLAAAERWLEARA